MTKNFGSREIRKSGRFALSSAMLSHSSIATMADRWNRFCDFLEEGPGAVPLPDITRAMVQSYGAYLFEQCKTESLSPATAQNYLSAVNRVMEIARGDDYCYVSPVHGALLPRRRSIATTNKSITNEEHERAAQVLPQPLVAMICLQRELGLRFEESAKINALAALREAESLGEIQITDGTKGGRSRKIPITSDEQLHALREAVGVQIGRSMIPPELSYRQFREQAYIEARRADLRFHGERHWYAQRRYHDLVGAECPVASGVTRGDMHIAHLSERLGISREEAREIDRTSRAQIAEELGHSRIQITDVYLG